MHSYIALAEDTVLSSLEVSASLRASSSFLCNGVYLIHRKEIGSHWSPFDTGPPKFCLLWENRTKALPCGLGLLCSSLKSHHCSLGRYFAHSTLTNTPLSFSPRGLYTSFTLSGTLFPQDSQSWSFSSSCLQPKQPLLREAFSTPAPPVWCSVLRSFYHHSPHHPCRCLFGHHSVVSLGSLSVPS